MGLWDAVAAKAELIGALLEALNKIYSETQSSGAHAYERDEALPEEEYDAFLVVLATLTAFLGNYSTREQFWAAGGPSTVTALLSWTEGVRQACHVIALL